MQGKVTLLDSLFEKAEAYAKTNIDLFKLKTIDKSADIISKIVAKIAVIFVVLLIVLFLNIALSLWLGELVGKSYYGFLIVAGFYILAVLILHFNRSSILEAPINDSIILQLIKEKEQ